MIASLGASGVYSSDMVSQTRPAKKAQATEVKGEQNDKIALLAKQINDGTYAIDVNSLAKKIADELA